MLGTVVYLFYNAFFCGALAYTIHKTLKKALLSVNRQHIVCILIVVATFLVLIFTTSDKPFHHTCSFKTADSSSLGLFFMHTLLTIFSLISLKQFKRNIPKNSFFEKQSHFKYYFIYMVYFCIF